MKVLSIVRILAGTLLAAGSLAACGGDDGASGPAFPAFTAYDDFSAGLSLNKWTGCSFDRGLASGALQLGMTCNDMAPSADYTLNANAITASSTIAVEADFIVNSAGVTLPSGGQIHAMIELRYQPQQFRGISDQDLTIARLDVRDTGSGLMATAFALICTNASCSTGFNSFTPVAGDTLSPLSLSYNTTYTGTVRYDAANNEFEFSIGGAATGAMEVSTTPLTGFNAADFREPRLRTRIRSGPSANLSGSVSATFDNVMVDTGGGLLPFDDFTAPNIDYAMWEFGEMSRGVVNGALEVYQRQGNLQRSNNTSIANASNVRGLRADVQVPLHVESSSNVLSGARVSQFLYNDGSVGDGRGGRNGDIGAQIVLRGAIALLEVFRCFGGDCNDGVLIHGENLGTFGTGSAHTLTIYWNGAQVLAQVDSEPIFSFDPRPLAPIVSAEPAGGRAPLIGVRGSNSLAPGTPTPAGQYGEIRARIDNVQTAP